MMNYIAVIHKDKNTGYGASFPEVGGCTAVSDTLDGILLEAREALELYLETIQELGREYPESKGLDYVLSNTHKQGLLTIAVIPVEIKEKSIRVNITIPEKHLKRIDRAAKKKKMSRSAFLTEMALQSIK